MSPFGELVPRRRPRGLAAWSPRREIERIFEDFFRDFPALTPRSFFEPSFPSIDMYEEKDRYIVKAEVPGLEKEDIHVSVTDNTLQLRGESRKEEKAEARDYYYNERYYGSFSRDISLPSAVKQDQIRATFKNGILTVEMPKSMEAVGKEIKIETK
jgi:HSP20 family protein